MDGTISIIWLAPGIYFLRPHMCDGSALCIDRDLTIQAITPGSVVLDADAVSSQEQRRVIKITGNANVNFIGLNITGGYAVSMKIDQPQSSFTPEILEPLHNVTD